MYNVTLQKYNVLEHVIIKQTLGIIHADYLCRSYAWTACIFLWKTRNIPILLCNQKEYIIFNKHKLIAKKWTLSSPLLKTLL